MSERAYSIEKKIEISAKTASDFAYKKELSDKRAFICCDKQCHIGLTCSNWGEPNGKKYYFRPSKNDELHIIGCTEISSNEERTQIDREKNCAKSTIRKNGLIKMTKSVNKAKTDISERQNNEVTSRNKVHIRSNNGNFNGNKRESRNIYSVASIVELNNDVAINHTAKIIMVDGEALSLDELFISMQDELVFNEFRIFHGKATISTGFKEGMLQINFDDYENMRIYSNIDAITKRSYGKIVKECLDKDASIYVYARGKIIMNGDKVKLVSFNDAVYKDLCFVK